MNTKTITYICIALAAIVIFLVFTNLNYSQEPDIVIDKNETIKHAIDNDFVKNEVLIGIKDNVTKKEIEDYLKTISEIENYETLGYGSYVITINYEFENREELGEFCNKLLKNKSIEYCEANNIIKLDDCSKGPC